MSSRGARLVLAVLLGAHLALALVTARGTSVTIDEAGHIASGIVHHQQGSLASYRVNPPLARWLATLPIVLLQDPPTLVALPDVPGLRPEGRYGAQLATAAGARYASMVFVARLFNVLVSALGLVLVFVLASRMFGVRGGLLAAACYAFDPNLLAHAAVLTSDMPASTMLLASTWALLRYLRRPTINAAILAGALLGVAQLTKFSALVLYPCWGVVGTIVAVRAASALRPRLRHAAVIVATSLVVLNAGYAFSGTGTRLRDYSFISRSFSGHPAEPGASLPGNRFAASALGGLPLPLPRDYVLGIDLQRRDFESHLRSYLDGGWHDGGFWYYYLYAFALKTPLPMLALGGCALGAALRRRLAARSIAPRDLAMIAVPLAFFVFISAQTGFSHHLRYVLPAIPFFAIAVGSLGPLLERRGWLRRLVVAAAAASAICVVALVPHQLSYFNALGGGWRDGDQHLVDSNIDWGQDLERLAAWYRAHGRRRCASRTSAGWTRTAPASSTRCRRARRSRGATCSA